jgi:hypothetical protein
MPVVFTILRKSLNRKQEVSKAGIGHMTAKVPSSSLDKITAEFLELELGGKPTHPPPTATRGCADQNCSLEPEPVVVAAPSTAQSKLNSILSDSSPGSLIEVMAPPTPVRRWRLRPKPATQRITVTIEAGRRLPVPEALLNLEYPSSVKKLVSFSCHKNWRPRSSTKQVRLNCRRSQSTPSGSRGPANGLLSVL